LDLSEILLTADTLTNPDLGVAEIERQVNCHSLALALIHAWQTSQDVQTIRELSISKAESVLVEKIFGTPDPWGSRIMIPEIDGNNIAAIASNLSDLKPFFPHSLVSYHVLTPCNPPFSLDHLSHSGIILPTELPDETSYFDDLVVVERTGIQYILEDSSFMPKTLSRALATYKQEQIIYVVWKSNV
jgi:hypothetical protein